MSPCTGGRRRRAARPASSARPWTPSAPAPLTGRPYATVGGSFGTTTARPNLGVCVPHTCSRRTLIPGVSRAMMLSQKHEGEGARDEPAPVVPRGPGPGPLAGARRDGGDRPRAADTTQALVGPDRLCRARGDLRDERCCIQDPEGPPDGEPCRGGRAPPQALLTLPAVELGAALRALRISQEPVTAAEGQQQQPQQRSETVWL